MLFSIPGCSCDLLPIPPSPVFFLQETTCRFAASSFPVALIFPFASFFPVSYSFSSTPLRRFDHLPDRSRRSSRSHSPSRSQRPSRKSLPRCADLQLLYHSFLLLLLRSGFLRKQRKNISRCQRGTLLVLHPLYLMLRTVAYSCLYLAARFNNLLKAKRILKKCMRFSPLRYLIWWRAFSIRALIDSAVVLFCVSSRV